MAKDYGSWSLSDLKNELRKRNAKLTGKKADLVQRLIDYDNLFGNIVNDPDSTYRITEPDGKYFLDITSDSAVPVLNEDDLNRFTALTEREDVSTAANMYKEGFLSTCRLAYEAREGVYFVTAMCSSEMRKSISYKVTIKLKDHLILETQCECAAGMGPYAQCKHIVVAIYGVIDFMKTKTIVLNKSCTSRLQTFHQPSRPYTGNPVKAEELALKAMNTNLNNISTFDPRPPQSFEKENYGNNFTNLVTNYCATYNSNIPISQLVRSADKKSFYAEHDYLEQSAENKFLDDNILSKEQRDHLEQTTKINKKVWKQECLKRLQSSDFGRICKCSDSGKEKLARSLLKNNEITAPAIKHGLKYENEAISQFKRQTGLDVQKCGLFVHEELQFLGSTPDGLVGIDGVVEVKCPYSSRNENISPENVDYLFLCDRTGMLKLKTTHNYYYQIQGQLLCTNRQTAYFCVYTLCDFKVLIIKRDEDFIKSLTDKLSLFYNNCYKNIFLDRYLYNKRK